jgi:uncharacterized membrane protein
MPFCGNCGAQVEGRFCAKCGATVGAPAGPPPAAGYPPPVPPPGASYPPPVPPAGTAAMADNAASALCYVLGFITGILFLVLEPYNKNRTIRFHAFQSIFLFVALVVVAIALSIFDALFLHLIGWWLVWFVMRLFDLALFAVWIYMIVTTYQGRTTVLPIIGPLAQQQA